MKYWIFFLASYFPAFLFAQAPSLYDTWTQLIGDTETGFVISKTELKFIDLRKHRTVSSQKQHFDSAGNTIRQTAQISKVIFDSARAKGRIFCVMPSGPEIICFRFLILNSGELIIGISDKSHSKRFTDLEEIISASSQDEELKDALNLLNSHRIEVYQRLKDPVQMPEDEVLALAKIFPDRYLAALERAAKESQKYIRYKGGTLFSIIIGQLVSRDLLVERGYNPLRFSEAYQKFSTDSVTSKPLKECLERAEMEFAKFTYSDSNADHPPKPQKKKLSPKPAPGAKKTHKDPASIRLSESPDVFPASPSQATQEEIPDPDEFIAIEKEAMPLWNIRDSLIYPSIAVRASLEGKVKFSALIGKDGRVRKVIIESSDNHIFDQAVIDAVTKTRFSPAGQNGSAISTWYRQTISFRLH